MGIRGHPQPELQWGVRIRHAAGGRAKTVRERYEWRTASCSLGRCCIFSDFQSSPPPSAAVWGCRGELLYADAAARAMATQAVAVAEPTVDYQGSSTPDCGVRFCAGTLQRAGSSRFGSKVLESGCIFHFSNLKQVIQTVDLVPQKKNCGLSSVTMCAKHVCEWPARPWAMRSGLGGRGEGVERIASCRRHTWWRRSLTRLHLSQLDTSG